MVVALDDRESVLVRGEEIEDSVDEEDPAPREKAGPPSRVVRQQEGYFALRTVLGDSLKMLNVLLLTKRREMLF